MTISKSGPHRD